tara:strand:+ start:3257 stop:3460 length:204 start_codon:yes stop_codon:yes gene_type:complete
MTFEIEIKCEECNNCNNSTWIEVSEKEYDDWQDDNLDVRSDEKFSFVCPKGGSDQTYDEKGNNISAV